MRIHVIACQVFFRPLSWLAARSAHTVSISWLPQGLHDTPSRLNQMLRQELDRLEEQQEKRILKHRPQAIVLGYGLCSNGVVGLEAGEVPLIAPRTDDCIGLLLGSQARYLEAFARHPGTYWVSDGWMEYGYVPTREALEQRRRDYVEQYGEENADFLMEQDQQWRKHYTTVAYIDSPLGARPEFREAARQIGEDQGWSLVEYPGELGLLERLVNGPWEDEEFLVCPPGHRIIASNDERKIAAEPRKRSE
ncbi:MAG TPA: DUF1638 domain-containing protein [Firmicutes bacterium]|nr:DUF1638 domain-containing protein [Bacillota bacterium]